jgi:phospholipase C
VNTSRRDFLKTISAAASVGAAAAQNVNGQSAIQHIVVVTMENRSFDHFLGWMHQADGRQAGLSYPDRNGVLRATHPLAPDYQGCGHPDPDHSYQGGRVEYDNGACNGWLRAGQNDDYAIGYYTAADLPFLSKAAPEWTTLARYFAPTMSSTYPNRMYLHAAQTDRIGDTLGISVLPTIWDRLLAKGISARYYYNDVPFLALWGPTYLPIAFSFDDFLQDCASGKLPAVSYVDPRFLGEISGISGDDHPHADIRNGEAFLNSIYEAVTSSPAWSSTVLVITFDEWGGFFDHVRPSTAPDVNPAFALRGFRVPALLISPWSIRRRVDRTVFDHTSILKMIETRWGLAPLTVRDASAANLAEALNFSYHDLAAPRFEVPPGPFGGPCLLQFATAAAAADEWTQLQEFAAGCGWRT